MPRPALLTDSELSLRMDDFPQWELLDDIPPKRIVRTISTVNFLAAVGLIQSIAILAEVLDHHPDLRIFSWNKVSITFSTHDQGGLTELDFLAAKKVDELIIS